MTLIVAMTAASGLLASMLLSNVMPSMWMRYPLCVLLAYAVFVLLIRIWCRTRNWDLPNFSADGGDGHVTPQWRGDGGQSGGGGASASFSVDEPMLLSVIDADAVGTVDASDAFSSADDGWPVFLLLGLFAGSVLAMVWMVWIAPIMLAELALDVALSAGLYRTMKRVDADNWLHITLRHTLRPFAAAFVCAALVGGVMQWIEPQATTLGEVFSERTASGE